MNTSRQAATKKNTACLEITKYKLQRGALRADFNKLKKNYSRFFVPETLLRGVSLDYA